MLHENAKFTVIDFIIKAERSYGILTIDLEIVRFLQLKRKLLKSFFFI